MAISFTDQLNQLLANNKPDRALVEIFEAFRLFKKKNPEKAREIDELETNLIMLSARMKELQNKEQTIQLSSNEIEVARARLFSSLIQVIKGLYEYPSFSEFLNTEIVEVVREESPTSIKPEMPPIASPAVPFSPAHHTAPPSYQPPRKGGLRTGAIAGIIAAVVGIGLIAVWAVNLRNNPSLPPSELPQVNEEEASLAADKQLWGAAKKSNTLASYEMYVLANENGAYADSAQARIDTLISQEEIALWTLAESTNTRQAYEEYLKKSTIHRFGALANERITTLLETESGSAMLKALITISNNDTLTLNQKVALITAGMAELKTISDKAEVKKYLDTLQSVQSQYANIKTEADFVVARGVSDRMPVGVDSLFSQRSIWAWAKTSAPSSETVRFVWYNENEEQLKVRAHKVEGYDSYRIFTQHAFDAPGKYEVRLYNDHNTLIARRKFEIKS